uniref:C2H2-type domain-containing protein n=1 Tax=Timema cristinae TaxID=61476 RepID=A0A7R9C9D3_TIMCR|nr:unnamed protein product [Timema cristinae]
MHTRQYVCTGVRHDIREKNFTNMIVRTTTIPSQLPCPHCINYTASPAGDDDKGGICHELIVADTNAMSGPKGNSHVNKSSPLRRAQLSTNEGRRRSVARRSTDQYSWFGASFIATLHFHVSRLVFQCTWPSCGVATSNCTTIETHVRKVHLGPKLEDSELSDHEEEFYYTELELRPHTYSPPTMSHRDMARPPHEDPEYQKQLKLGVFRASPINIPSTGGVPWSSAATSPRDTPVPVCTQQDPGEPHQEGARRHQEVSQGVWHGASRVVVHTMQVEESLYQVWGLEGSNIGLMTLLVLLVRCDIVRDLLLELLSVAGLVFLKSRLKSSAVVLMTVERESLPDYSARDVELSDVDNDPKRAQISEEGMDSGIVA